MLDCLTAEGSLYGSTGGIPQEVGDRSCDPNVPAVSGSRCEIRRRLALWVTSDGPESSFERDFTAPQR